MINKLIKGDNIEIMKSIDENYVDLIITSPPYDDLRDYEKKINWNFEIFKEVAKEMFRVLKEGGVLHFKTIKIYLDKYKKICYY